jgi:RHS repeat-associated protein
VASSGSIENDYRFAGEQYDENLERYYLRQRYYDAGIGRFTRRDTYEGRLGNPVTLHKYLYANGNPVNYVDPSGLYSIAEANLATSIANTLNEIQFWQGQQLLAMAGGGDEPTPSSIAWDTLFGLGLLTAAPLLIATISVSARISAGIIRTASRVAAKFKIGECDICAVNVKAELMRKGIHGKHIRISTPSNRGVNGNIWSDTAGELISYNGFHEANVIEINGVEMVFDNVHPGGIPKAGWYADMDTPLGDFTETIIEEY